MSLIEEAAKKCIDSTRGDPNYDREQLIVDVARAIQGVVEIVVMAVASHACSECGFICGGAKDRLREIAGKL